MIARAIAPVRPRGGPLVMLLLLLAAWIGGRAVWWESPWPALEMPDSAALAADLPPRDVLIPATGEAAVVATGDAFVRPLADARAPAGGNRGRARVADAPLVPGLAPGSHTLSGPALGAAPAGGAATPADPGLPSSSPPFLPAPPPSSAQPRADRWSIDAWAFWRQGSGATPVSQGRVPIYGASQAGGVLQYRLAPGGPHDPRLYARAYQALVQDGERELALGASARPLGRVPVRVAGEVRYTDAAFSDSWRPAAFAMSELPPSACRWPCSWMLTGRRAGSAVRSLPSLLTGRPISHANCHTSAASPMTAFA